MTFTVGLAQCDVTLGDVEKNAEIHREWIQRARAKGVDLLVFPELSLTGYLLQDMVPEVSRRPDDELLRDLSREAGPMALAISGIEESEGHGQYISSFYLEDGELRHVHRKVYLANYGVFDEGRYVGSGHRIAAAPSRFGKLGLMICEDAWHPSLVSVMLLDGAALLVVQVASPLRDLRQGELPHNAAIWLDTMRTYARLYGCYIAFCNRVGGEDGLVFWGHSCLFGPDGDVVSQGPLYDPELVVGEVDLERVREARLSNPVLRDEKLDLTRRELRRLAEGDECR